MAFGEQVDPRSFPGARLAPLPTPWGQLSWFTAFSADGYRGTAPLGRQRTLLAASCGVALPLAETVSALP